MTTGARPAFYALAPGGWRDYVTLLHPPYTLWHLSYVAIGAGLAPELHLWRLGAALAAFFLGMGVAAHALDELRGRPLRTQIPSGVLVGLAGVSLSAAVAIGIAGAVVWEPWLLAFVAGGAVLAVAYNLELLGGRLHTDAWFALGWGSLPLLATYLVMAGRITPEAILGALYAALLSLAQRRLSTPVRAVRRRVTAVYGTIQLADGSREPITRETLTGTAEQVLRALTLATVALAAALIVLRLS